jgi:murein DD-endopeptidase MepM/ murein hydrolase activator NlpD
MAIDQQLKQSVEALFGPAFRVSQGYSASHDGVDIAAVAGTPLHAIAGGTVSYAQNENGPGDPRDHWALGGGNVVNIDIPGNRTLQFAHLQSIDVKVPDQVTVGQLIGRIGSSGFAHGSHVHFGLWDHATNKMIRPYAYLADLAAQPPTVTTLAAVQVTESELFAPPRQFAVRAGSTLRAYDPARPNRVIRQHFFGTRSSAAALAIVRIAWPGAEPQPVPHGIFLRVANGMFARLYIPALEVELAPA